MSTTKINRTIDLGPDGNSFQHIARVGVYNASDHLVSSAVANANGVRMLIERISDMPRSARCAKGSARNRCESGRQSALTALTTRSEPLSGIPREEKCSPVSARYPHDELALTTFLGDTNICRTEGRDGSGSGGPACCQIAAKNDQDPFVASTKGSLA